MKKKVYEEISLRLGALENCNKTNNREWYSRHYDAIRDIVANYLPSGIGVDSGVTFEFEESKPERLVFSFGYHHMDEFGGYDGWTDHKAIVTPSLAFGFILRITGKDRNGIKDYLHECFSVSLSKEIDDA